MKKKIRHSLVLFATLALMVGGLLFALHVKAPVSLTRFLHFTPETKILFVGDLFFDRTIRQAMEREGGDYIFSCVNDLLRGADLVVGNLEGPITGNASVSVGSAVGSPDNFRFTFPPETAALLASYNIRAVNIGNNHIGNFGLEGIRATKDFLNASGVAYFGGLDGDEPIYRAEMDGVPLSFISFNEFGGSEVEKVAQTIAQERLAERVVIVYAHWGDEYVEAPERVRATAQALARSGASAIIGSHPHVVLGSERVGDTLVYWSLGNFFFDQYWNKEVSRGLAVQLTLTPEGIKEVEEYAVELLRDRRTCPVH